MQRRSLVPHLLLAGLFAFFAAFLLYPIWLTIASGFESSDGGFTLYHVFDVFRDEASRRGLFNALGIAVATTILSFVIGLPLAILAARFDFRGKGVMSALILVPLILPPFVGAIGLHHLLGRTGAINTLLIDIGFIEQGVDFIGQGGFWAIVFVEALHLYPILYLNATAALANLDPALEEAAENLGASPWRRFKDVVLPLIRPGLFAGATIVFIWSFTELGTPLMFNYQDVTPVQIFNGIKEMAASKQPYALTAVLLLCAVGFYVLGKLVFGGKAYAMYAKASAALAPGGNIAWVTTTPHADVGTDCGITGTDFSTFVLSLGTSALYHLGFAPDPDRERDEAPPKRPDESDQIIARQTIGTLEMIAEKTRGNLQPDEEKLLESILYELRMRHVAVRK